MPQQQPIRELVENVAMELKSLNYYNSSISNFRAFYKRLIKFSDKEEEIYYSEALGIKFLVANYGCTIKSFDQKTCSSNSKTQNSE